MIELQNIQLPLDAGLKGGEKFARRAVVQATGVHECDIKSVRVLKRSVDARRKSNVHFVVTLGVEFCADRERELEREILSNGCSARGVNVKKHEPYEPLEIPCLGALPEQSGRQPLRSMRFAQPSRLTVACTNPVETVNQNDAKNSRPIVVGTGPAGLFAALYLARAGLRPLVLERGGSVEQRAQAVDEFFNGGELNLHSNIQFGEGGAGTFSDGKLTTNTKNPLTKHVLRWFVEAGAPPEIEMDAKPHIGTDKLRDVVRNMRKQIEDAGGEVRFNTQLTGLNFSNGRIVSVELERMDFIGVRGATNANNISSKTAKITNSIETILATHVILACGHSARDTYRMLQKAHIKMERKPFSVGVRIEHKQTDINRAQYGKFAKHPALRAADYKLSTHLSNGRGVYTFCMCPGGVVVPAASQEGGVCTNGMSYHARAGQNANAALLVSVDPKDFDECEDMQLYERETEQESACAGNHNSRVGSVNNPNASKNAHDHRELQDLKDPLAGIYFQERIERAAYALAQRTSQHTAHKQVNKSSKSPNTCSIDETMPYAAPAQTIESFLNHTKPKSSTKIKPTYSRGVVWADLHDCLPTFVAESLEAALPLLNKKLHGFADPQAILTGAETRSSSPVRIIRNENFQAELTLDVTSTPSSALKPPTGLYPCGEGAGYAGGIMSAAVDGLKVARALCEQQNLTNKSS